MSVLVVRVGAMGDVLHALPAVAALRQQRPELPIGWVVDPRWAPLLIDSKGQGPVVSRIYQANTRLWSRAPVSRATLRSVLALRTDLRTDRPFLAVDMQGTLSSAVIARLAGASRICGYSDPREAPSAWMYTERLPRREVHVVAQGAALLGAALGQRFEPVPAPLPTEEWAQHWAADLLAETLPGSPVCVLAAAAGWGAKQWPVERYAALGIALRDRGFRVLAPAPRGDDPVTAQVIAASGAAVEPVVCNVAGLIALLRRTALAVGGDTGPVHLAAMLGVPLVALFGPTDPARNGPWGPGPKRVLRHPASVTSYRHVAAPDPGPAQLLPDAVLAAAQEVLHEAQQPARSGELPRDLRK